jgi:hypothetical protein
MQKKLDTFALKFKTFGMQVVENLVVEKIQNLFDDSSVREDNIKMSFFSTNMIRFTRATQPQRIVISFLGSIYFSKICRHNDVANKVLTSALQCIKT